MPNTQTFTALERRASISLSAVMSLRLFGVFMLLPVLSLYAQNLPHATTAGVGLVLGIYGLTQAIFQLPFGIWSDHVPRKVVISFGLTLFILGSVLAALAQSLPVLIFARALQGAGAIGSACSALLADLTRTNQRTKAMAILGVSVGLAFTLGLLAGPLLQHGLSVPALFWINALLGVLSIVILYKTVPLGSIQKHLPPAINPRAIFNVLWKPNLLRLHFGMFSLHTILTALFLILPFNLDALGLSVTQQWHVYLPSLLLGVLVMLPFMRMSELPDRLKPVLVGAIICLILSLLSILNLHKTIFMLGVSLLFFFASFTLLEALLPSLLSRLAPPAYKGTAMGVFSSAQFLGIFCGGALGGWLYGKVGLSGVCCAMIVLAVIWLVIISTTLSK